MCPEIPRLLRKQYEFETVANKRMILVQLGEIGNEDDITFLEEKLVETDDQIKLEAVRALVKINTDNWARLATLAAENTVIEEISRQVKKEMAA